LFEPLQTLELVKVQEHKAPILNRERHAVVPLGEDNYMIIGGKNNKTIFDDTWMWNYTTNTFKKDTPLPHGANFQHL
jgi:hypothetical protein